MLTGTRLHTRVVTKDDRQNLANLVHFEAYVHRHLDYRPPLDWIGYHPFSILEQDGATVAALACPPDPPHVAWIRLFAVAHQFSVERAWEALWMHAYAQLQENHRPTWAAAIPMHPWLTPLLEKSDFEETHQIVMLHWEDATLPRPPMPPGVTIRPMTLNDLEVVSVVDQAAFVPVWQNSQAYLELAFQQATIATIAEEDGRVAAYQISTGTPIGGHLARLAVDPPLQGRGIGYALLFDLLTQFVHRGARCVTVNTQKDNFASIALYLKAGFQMTGEEYPIYQLDMSDEPL